MRKIVFLIIFNLIFMLPYAYGYSGFGICNFGKESLPSVICYGPSVLKQTTVANEVKVTGSLRASEVTTGAVFVTGAFYVDNSKIKGSVEVTGDVEVNKVEFDKDLNVTSAKVVFNQSYVKGSVIINSETIKPILKMQCGSHIDGSLTFNGEPGVIEITDDSYVKGKITNGTMEFIKVKCD